MNMNQYPDILTIEEVMDILLIGRNQCYELLNSGRLHGFKVGIKTWKIPRDAVIYFLKTEASPTKHSAMPDLHV